MYIAFEFKSMIIHWKSNGYHILKHKIDKELCWIIIKVNILPDLSINIPITIFEDIPAWFAWSE